MYSEKESALAIRLQSVFQTEYKQRFGDSFFCHLSEEKKTEWLNLLKDMQVEIVDLRNELDDNWKSHYNEEDYIFIPDPSEDFYDWETRTEDFVEFLLVPKDIATKILTLNCLS